MSKPPNIIIESEAYYKLASVWQLRGKPDLAIQAYKKSLLLNDAFVPACLELTSLLIERDELDSALETCKRTCERNPGNWLVESRLQEISDLILQVEVEPEGIDEKSAAPETMLIEPSEYGKTIVMYSDCAGRDGAEQCNHLIMMDLARAGYQLVCAQPFADHDLINERRRKGIRHVWLEVEDVYRGKEIAKSARAGLDAERFFEEIHLDLIIFSDGSPFSNLRAKKAARERDIPYFILTHCVNEQWCVQHSSRLAELVSAFEGAEEVVSVSQRNLDDLHTLFHLPRDKGKVVYNGRPEAFFRGRDQTARERLRAEFGISNDAVVCTTVARMEVMKGYQYLLDAIAGLVGTAVWGEVQFVWVGRGTLENRFRTRAAELGVDKTIHFVGSRRDVAEILDASDIFVLASQYEGMPLSIIEAMAKGLPVAASNVSGIPEALGDTGVLIQNPRKYPRAAVEELVMVIRRWVDEIKRGSALGQEGKVRALELFTAERMLNAYRKLVGDFFESHSCDEQVQERGLGNQ